jgi:hypothetical protein
MSYATIIDSAIANFLGNPLVHRIALVIIGFVAAWWIKPWWSDLGPRSAGSS